MEDSISPPLYLILTIDFYYKSSISICNHAPFDIVNESFTIRCSPVCSNSSVICVLAISSIFHWGHNDVHPRSVIKRSIKYSYRDYLLRTNHLSRYSLWLEAIPKDLLPLPNRPIKLCNQSQSIVPNKIHFVIEVEHVFLSSL